MHISIKCFFILIATMSVDAIASSTAVSSVAATNNTNTNTDTFHVQRKRRVSENMVPRYFYGNSSVSSSIYEQHISTLLDGLGPLHKIVHLYSKLGIRYLFFCFPFFTCLFPPLIIFLL